MIFFVWIYLLINLLQIADSDYYCDSQHLGNGFEWRAIFREHRLVTQWICKKNCGQTIRIDQTETFPNSPPAKSIPTAKHTWFSNVRTTTITTTTSATTTMTTKICLKVSSCPHGLAENIEGFLAVHMDLTKICLKGLAVRLDLTKIFLKGF